MKKKNLTKNSLSLNKNLISTFKTHGISGGGTESCIQDANTLCYSVACGTNQNCGTNNGCASNNCATQGFDCERTFSCDPGIC